MLEKIEKVLLGILTAILPVFIAACYGPGMEPPITGFDTGDTNVTDIVVKGTVKDSTGAPIGGILVTCLRGAIEVDSTYSLARDGSFLMEVADSDRCMSLAFEDVDDTQNGGPFARTVLNYTDESVDAVLSPE